MPNVRDLFRAAATGDATVFRDTAKGRSCDGLRILQKFEQKTRRELRRARGNEYKTRSSRVVSHRKLLFSSSRMAGWIDV